MTFNRRTVLGSSLGLAVAVAATSFTAESALAAPGAASAVKEVAGSR
ncbi:hypothetical protein NKH18_09465 [Streptomyces sp. M10(2022)]